MKFPGPHWFSERAQRYRTYLAETLGKLIRIPSLSGQEEKIVLFLQEEFRNIGADEVSIDPFGNIIARLGGHGPKVAFDAHIDTVDVGLREKWSFDPLAGLITENEVCGRGAADQKAGMASMLAALRITKEIDLPYPFTAYFVGSVLEEDCDGLCWQYIVKEDKLRPDVVVLTEPTDGHLNRGQRGRMEIEIVVRGVSAHGAAPERGDNAIYKMAPIIKAIKELNDKLPSDPFLGKGSITASRLRSSAPSLCAVADMAAVYLDRRLTAGETPASAREQLEILPEVSAAKAEVIIPEFDKPSWRGLSYPVPKVYAAWTLPENDHYLKVAKKSYAALFGEEPVVSKWNFSTNGVATMGIFGIPSLGFGPGQEAMAHAPDEKVAIEDLVKAAAFYAYFPWSLVDR